MNIKDFSKLFENDLYYCGGFVRDKIMDNTPNDIDICSSILPDDIIKKCVEKNIKHYYCDNSIAHGTVTILLDEGDVEHTTFRKDVRCDGRNTIIEFSDNLYDDSCRRDFTMNSLYENINTGEIIDYHNGVESINNKIIYFVGDVEKRIEEDYLRILRYFRFANRYNMDVSCKELNIIRKMIYMNGLKNISKERISMEIRKIMSDGINNRKLFIHMINLLKDFNSFFMLLNSMLNTSSINKYHSKSNVLEHCIDVVNKSREFLNEI